MSLQRLLSRWRVRSGVLAAILLLILARPTSFFLIIGAIISVMGLVMRGWASGHIQKEKELTISGPYRYTRNPLYLGNFVLGLGLVIGSHSWWALAIFFFYFLLFYPAIILEERERMRKLFPEKYEDYRVRVPLFFPSLKSRNKFSSPEKKFHGELYWKNKEYRALLGTLLFWLFLVAKFLFFQAS